MTILKSFKHAVALAIALPSLAVAANGCSAAQAAAEGCSGLSASASNAQASILDWQQALTDVNTQATTVQALWLKTCNEINGALGLDTSKGDAADACNVLSTYIQSDTQATLTVSVTDDCQVSVSAQATCEANANCTVTPATCTGGDVVVGCNGSCSASCDVTAPSFACNGTCTGECTANAAVSCSGTCTGTCTALTWSGSCTGGCSLTFSGSCGGNCTGTCKTSSGSSNVTSAACAGTCSGTCDANATGSCGAQCSGTFSGGTCSGQCTGKCNVATGASCSGTCNGTCTYTPGSATCDGSCHGTCSVTTSPPTCSGGNVNCQASATCQGEANAQVTCPPPQVDVTVNGDPLLYAAYTQYASDLGTAINETAALAKSIGALAQDTLSSFEAIGDVGAGGASCVGQALTTVSTIQASITVSVTASASVSKSPS